MSSIKGEENIRLILIGRTGSGKSRTGNTILGMNCFGFVGDAPSVTQVCSLHSNNRFGFKIDIVDTPGVFDGKRSMEDIRNEVKKSMIMTTPGPHAILLCIPIFRFTKDDIENISPFLEFFGEGMLKRTIVLFTKVDIWEQDLMHQDRQMSKEDYIAALPEHMRQFLSKCKDQYIFVNNRTYLPEHPEKIIATVVNIRKSLPNPFFTNESFRKIEKCVEEEEKKNRNTHRDEIKMNEGFGESIYRKIRAVISRRESV